MSFGLRRRSSISSKPIGLAFAHLTVMAAVMRLFESALTLKTITEAVGDRAASTSGC